MKAEMKVVTSRPVIEAESGREPAVAMIEIDHVSQVFQTSARQDRFRISRSPSETAPLLPFSARPAVGNRRCFISSVVL